MGRGSKQSRRDRAPRTHDARGTEAGEATPTPSTELAARLASLSTILQRHLRRRDGDDGLTRARLSALALLVLGGPHRLGELASAEGVRPPTMTRLVDAMETEGLVERRPDPDDGRSVIVVATAAGERVLADGRAERIAPLADAIDRLDREETATLVRSTDLLDRLLRSVER